jgi:methyl-accepting chemotaxis protein
MKFLNNLNIEKKLKLITFLPVSFLILFTSIGIYNAYIKYSDMSDVNEMTEYATHVSMLIHETQKERGATAGFIGSNGTKFVDKLPNQRKLTDKKIIELKNFLKTSTIDKFGNDFKDELNSALNSLKKIQSIRQKVTKLQIGAKNAISFYTKMNASFLNSISQITHYTQNAQIKQELISYTSFLMSKERAGIERAGIERAVGANTLSRDNFADGLKLKFINLINSQNTYLNSFLMTASSEAKSFYKKTLQGASINEVKKIRKIMLKEESGFGIDSQYWFTQITKKINKLKEVDNFLSKQIIQKSKDALNSALMIMLLLLVLPIIGIVSLLILSKNISQGLTDNFKILNNSITDFLSYIDGKGEHFKPMVAIGKDEFSEIANSLNKQAKKIESSLEQDKLVIAEIDDIMNKVANGYFGYSIKLEASSPAIEGLKRDINNMLQDSKKKFDYLQSIMSQYAKNNFSAEISEKDLDGMNGEIGSILNSTILLGENVSDLFAMMQKSGGELNDNTKDLFLKSQELINSSKNQEKYIGDTTKNIEEINSISRDNTKQIKNMLDIADDLTQKSDKGQKLALNSGESMSIIQSKVTAIDDAIAIIDQISFQTNILSLNAAVEAATAGEAGKGFAVVASEVRNLASKSLEASKEIKSLVSEANEATIEGKNATDSMLNGYKELNEKVLNTKQSIDTVTKINQDQATKISQVYDDIQEIKLTTDKNFKSADAVVKLSKRSDLLSKSLLKISNSAKFDPKVRSEVCDIELNTMISSMKNDHINFKNVILSKLDERADFKVVDSKSCNLGRWIKEQTDQDKGFTKTQAWSNMLHEHDFMHHISQEYVTASSKKLKNSKLKKIGNDIDKTTLKIFKALNNVKKEHCISFKVEKKETVETLM